MAIEILLKVNDEDFTAHILPPFIVGRPKLWGAGSGRVLSGKMDAILVGLFPKLTIEFYAEANDMPTLLTELDKPSQTLSYFDPRHNTNMSLGSYTSDYEVHILDLKPTYDKVKVSFISLDKE